MLCGSVATKVVALNSSSKLQIVCVWHMLCSTCIQNCHCKSLWEELSCWDGDIEMEWSDLNWSGGIWFQASLFMAMKLLCPQQLDVKGVLHTVLCIFLMHILGLQNWFGCCREERNHCLHQKSHYQYKPSSSWYFSINPITETYNENVEMVT